MLFLTDCLDCPYPECPWPTVQLIDWQSFYTCITGPDGNSDIGCNCGHKFDINNDKRLDLIDVISFQNKFIQ